MDLTSGRINQKMRTRHALLQAAFESMKDGGEVTIDEVAKRANVSKATAYRYFSSTESLTREAALHMQAMPFEKVLDGLEMSPTSEKLSAALDYFFSFYVENEQDLRLFMSTVLRESVANPDKELRGARRIPILEEALSEYRDFLTPEEFNTLIYSVCMVIGIESLITLKDVCKLDNQAIFEIWEWSIAKMLAGVKAELPQEPGRTSRKPTDRMP